MCYHKREVSRMEEERLEAETEEAPRYQPRPKWQVWLARAALFAFIIVLILYYATYFRRGA